MSWCKIDDGAPDHPKFLAAGGEASWYWVCGLAYCNKQKRRTGFIPAQKALVLFPAKSPRDLIKALVEVVLWVEVEGGYQMHDYAEWNGVSPEVAAARIAAGSLGGRSKRQANAKQTPSKTEANAKQNPEAFASGLLADGEANAKQNGSKRQAKPKQTPEPESVSFASGTPSNHEANLEQSSRARVYAGESPNPTPTPIPIPEREPPNPPSGGEGSEPEAASQVRMQSARVAAGAMTDGAWGMTAEAYREGIRSVTSKCAPLDVRGQQDVQRAVAEHGEGRKGEELLAWVRASAAEFASSEDATRGVRPGLWVAWLDKPKARARPAYGRTGPAFVQPTDETADWMTLDSDDPLPKTYGGTGT